MSDANEPNEATGRVAFRLIPDEDGYPPADWEHLWAIRRPDGNFQLDNTPFFAQGVSLGDVVATVPDEGMNVFHAVVERSGHSTIRVILFDESQVESLRSALRQRGCPSELSHVPGLVAIDIPPTVTLSDIRQYLDAGVADGLWDYEEASIRD